MRIVVWGINYAPEKTGIGLCNVALCEYLAGCGHDVTMLTAFPYYPEWKKRKADDKRLFASERVNAVRILRCWHYVPQRVTTRKRILHELSFVAFSFFRLLLMPEPRRAGFARGRTAVVCSTSRTCSRMPRLTSAW